VGHRPDGGDVKIIVATLALQWGLTSITRILMPLTGEAIRLMNYIDDVAVTLRRVLALIPTLSPEERQRIATHLEHSSPNAEDVAKALGGK
jgi:hypothetical protein